jgi:hypothetical protein
MKTNSALFRVSTPFALNHLKVAQIGSYAFSPAGISDGSRTTSEN